mmetsp:Transcript_130444/g.225544  ORF Transcript_130444/g.225544 Transcript_130444/m.225544 type:complete len:288 (+) Transcript_130444:1449-2312(+)
MNVTPRDGDNATCGVGIPWGVPPEACAVCWSPSEVAGAPCGWRTTDWLGKLGVGSRCWKCDSFGARDASVAALGEGTRLTCCEPLAPSGGAGAARGGGMAEGFPAGRYSATSRSRSPTNTPVGVPRAIRRVVAAVPHCSSSSPGAMPVPTSTGLPPGLCCSTDRVTMSCGRTSILNFSRHMGLEVRGTVAVSTMSSRNCIVQYSCPGGATCSPSAPKIVALIGMGAGALSAATHRAAGGGQAAEGRGPIGTAGASPSEASSGSACSTRSTRRPIVSPFSLLNLINTF